MTVTTTLEPKGKLGATSVVNGPEDEPLSWESVSWLSAESNVRRLRQRIFTASQAGDFKRVRNLQKLMLRSQSNALVSVRRVTEINAGRKTAGIDGEVALTGEAKADLAEWVQRRAEPWTARPVKRVYIPKRGSAGKQRPLGIPVIADRALQAVAANALEPEWEARFEPRSYGFRPGRGCHDAIEAIFQAGKGGNGAAPRRPWILDADLAAAFDRIGHDHLLSQLGTFPARELIARWLRAGVVEDGRFTPTGEGVPQGGVISPCLLNVALHGMEGAAGVRYKRAGSDATFAAPGSPVLIRYADDLAVFCHTRQEAEQVKARLAEWLAPRGLAFNEDKTRIVTLGQGFDFLGVNVRRYDGKLLIKPAKAAIRRIRERLRTELRSLRGPVRQRSSPGSTPSSGAGPPTTGRWYPAKSSVRWITTCGSSPTSGPSIATRTSRPGGSSAAISASSTSPGATCGCSVIAAAAPTCSGSPGRKSSGTRWSKAPRPRTTPPWPDTGLLQSQSGRCALCQELLLDADHPPQTPREWEQWLTVTRKAMIHNAITAQPDGPPDEAKLRLLHAHCHRQHARKRKSPALLPASEPTGLA